MKRLPALPLLHWGLPVLAFGLGAIAFLASGLRLSCRCGTSGMPVFLVALYFTTLGLVALVARWRDATNLADGALLAIVSGVAVGALGIETDKLLALRRPLSTVSGELASVSVVGSHRLRSAGATLILAGGRRLTWSCGWFDCRGRDDALSGLHRDLPLPVQMQVAGSQLVGLAADGVQILDPERELPRQFGARVLSVGFCGLILAGLTLFGYFRWRRTKARYVRPSPTVLPKLRRLRP
jgi:hypothetical protein